MRPVAPRRSWIPGLMHASQCSTKPGRLCPAEQTLLAEPGMGTRPRTAGGRTRRQHRSWTGCLWRGRGSRQREGSLMIRGAACPPGTMLAAQGRSRLSSGDSSAGRDLSLPHRTLRARQQRKPHHTEVPALVQASRPLSSLPGQRRGPWTRGRRREHWKQLLSGLQSSPGKNKPFPACQDGPDSVGFDPQALCERLCQEPEGLKQDTQLGEVSAAHPHHRGRGRTRT